MQKTAYEGRISDWSSDVCSSDLVKADAGIEAWTRLGDAGDLAGTVLAHPWRGVAAAAGGYDFGVPVLAGDFVTTEQGTGFVHSAPGHGADDWALGLTQDRKSTRLKSSH